MSTTYLLYTEAKIDGKWRCIDGFVPYKYYGSQEEEPRLMTTYESGSRSYFGETSDELISIGERVPFSELSKEVQEEHPNLRYRDPAFVFDEDNDENVEECYTVIYENDLNNKMPKGHQHHGIYHKDEIAAFESGEIEYMSEDENRPSLKSMSEEEQKCYQYYEWDDPMGWFYNIRIVKEAFDTTVNKYMRSTLCYDNLELRLVMFVL